VHRPAARAEALIRPGAVCRTLAIVKRAAFVAVATAWLSTVAAAEFAANASAPPPDPLPNPLPNPISEPGHVWAFDGFALKPPSGSEWYSLVKSRDEVVFARRAIDPSYALIAAAHAERVDRPPATPEGLAELVRRRAPRSPDTLRYEIKERAAELEPAASWCVRYRLRAEDSRSSFFYPHIVRITGRICAHPGSHGLLIDASYAERAVEGESQPEALKEGEAFLDGLRLMPMPPRAVADADALIERGDAGEAVKLLAPLAEQGHAQAAQMLGAAYERGQGVAPDLVQANRWYRVAAEAGEVDALYNLGTLHEHANGGLRDAQEALRWFRLAADQRDSQAQLNLGLHYLKGDGVKADPRQARFWFELAASNGSERARSLLGKLFP